MGVEQELTLIINADSQAGMAALAALTGGVQALGSASVVTGTQVAAAGVGIMDAFTGIGTVIAAIGLEKFLKGTTDAASAAQASTTRLSVAIDDTGESYAGQKAAIDAVVVSGAKLGFTHQDTIESLGTLTTMTGSAEKAILLEAEAEDLATFTGKGLAFASTMVARVQEGKIGIAARYLPFLSATMSAEEAQAVLQERVAGQATEHARAEAGANDVWKASTNELSIEIGDNLLPILTTLEQTGSGIIDWFLSLPTPIKNTVEAVAGIGTVLIVVGGAIKTFQTVWTVGSAIVATAAATKAAAVTAASIEEVAALDTVTVAINEQILAYQTLSGIAIPSTAVSAGGTTLLGAGAVGAGDTGTAVAAGGTAGVLGTLLPWLGWGAGVGLTAALIGNNRPTAAPLNTAATNELHSMELGWMSHGTSGAPPAASGQSSGSTPLPPMLDSESQTAIKNAEEQLISTEASANEQRLNAQESFDKSMEDAQYNFNKSTASLRKSFLDQEASAWKSYNDSLKAEADKLANSTPLFDAIQQQTNVSASTLVVNIAGQVQQLTQWQSYLATLKKRGVSEAILTQLSSAGPGNIADVSALATASDDQLKKWTSLYGQRLKTVQPAAKSAMAPQLAETQASVAKMHADFDAQSAQLVEDLKHRQSDIAKTLLKQLDSTQASVTKAMKNLADVLAADGGPEGEAAATALVNGFSLAVGNNLPIVQEAMQSIAEYGIKTPFADALDIHSPSGVFAAYGENSIQSYIAAAQAAITSGAITPYSIGESLALGVADGILSKAGQAQAAAYALVQGMLSSMNPSGSSSGSTGSSGSGVSGAAAAGLSTGVGKGSFTSEQWARAFLTAAGLPVTAQNLKNIETWERYESGSNVDRWNNPLNTTQGAPGAANMNSGGVKSYISEAQGLDATLKTLNNVRYGPIINALKHSVGLGAFEHAVGSTPWGTFHGYRDGGVAIGPDTGYLAMLHGKEVVFNSAQIDALSGVLGGGSRRVVNGPLIGQVIIQNDYDVRKLMVELQAEFDTEQMAQGVSG
jgi:hypothetical protein